ncbi:hypothetical protein ACQKP5_26610 [Pseudomonas vancouverensis]|uniref:hypothetical protein n=1 Tax=Pseudomonas vancouverensis TaxID=95300 RepID=UPI003D0363D1
MHNLTRYLTAFVFSVAGVAAHANASVEQSACGSSTCFQMTPVAEKGDHGFLVENGSSHTPQGQYLDNQTA